MRVLAQGPACGEEKHGGVEHPLNLAECVRGQRFVEPSSEVSKDGVDRSDRDEEDRKPGDRSTDAGRHALDAPADGVDELHFAAEITDLSAWLRPLDTMPASLGGDQDEFDR